MKLQFKNTQERIDEKLIFKHISQEYIYYYFLKETPNTTKSFKSPFTDDNNPSFRFIFKGGELYFKCFSSGLYGNCIEFAKQILNLSYFDTLNYIYYNICISKGFSSIKKKSKIEIDQKQEHVIKVILRDFEEVDYNYWKQYYITSELLLKYNIRACEEVWSNDILWYSNTLKNPCYRYLFNGKYKIYKPFETNKKLKFNSSCNNLENLQGIKQVFPHDTLIITKSYKDIIVLNEYCKIPSIALHGEGHFPPDKVVKWIIKNYKNVVIFYDNDSPGIKASKKLKEFFNKEYSLEVKEICIPEEFRLRAKDPSDFIKEYGVENLQITIKFLLNENT